MLLQPGAVVVGVSGVIFAIAGWAVLRDVHRSRALGTAAWGMLPAGVIYTLLAPNVSIGAHFRLTFIDESIETSFNFSTR